MNVYAVYRSPPSRNQMTTVPKPRPPRPHSFRCSRSSARRHRAAANPTPVTSRNRTTKIVNDTALTLLMSVASRRGRYPLGQRGSIAGPGMPAVRRGARRARRGRRPALGELAQQVGTPGDQGDDRHPQELVPVEERPATPGGGQLVVERDPERRGEN